MDKKIGKKIEIEYHKNNPEFIQVGENNILYEMSIWMIIFGALGTGVTGYILYKRRCYLDKNL